MYLGSIAASSTTLVTALYATMNMDILEFADDALQLEGMKLWNDKATRRSQLLKCFMPCLITHNTISFNVYNKICL